MISDFTYDRVARRYRLRRTGRFLASAAVRVELDSIIDRVSKRAELISRKLMAHQISLAEWQDSLESEIRNVHLTFSIAAHGGLSQMTEADYARVSSRIETQFRFLSTFARDIYTGEQRLTPFIATRAIMYVEAGRGTYEAERAVVEIAGGATEECNIRGALDNCKGCLDATSAGWQPVGTLVPIGLRNCLTRCRCTLTYRSTKTLT